MFTLETMTQSQADPFSGQSQSRYKGNAKVYVIKYNGEISAIFKTKKRATEILEYCKANNINGETTDITELGI